MAHDKESSTESRHEGSDEKGKKKQLKELQESFEVLPLEPSERYRALNDMSKQHEDLMGMADRSTRFALVILAALNTVNFVILAKPEILTNKPATAQGVPIAVYGAFYAGLSLYLCTQAIGALRPRLSDALQRIHDVSSEQKWLNLLSLDVIHTMPADDYYELWRTAQFGQLNREIAFRNQTTAQIILKKYAALRRLYTGLTFLVFLTLTIILVFLYSRAAG